MQTTDSHASKVKAIQAQIGYFHERRETVRIYHGSTNTTRNTIKDKRRLIDVSQLTDVLHINVSEQYIVAEANVAMDALVDAALAEGFIPQVVPELPSITIGGAVQGGAGESSSFRYGCLHAACLEYEIILADGTLVTASDTQNQDLFNGIVCSYGSVGIITAVKMRLMPAKPFIKLTYQPVNNYQSALQTMSTAMAAKTDFIDGILYAATKGVVMTGVFCDQSSDHHSTFSKFTDEWFYLHAERIIDRHQTYTETIPTKDYLFRYDRGAFWVARYGFEMFHVPFSRFTRVLLAGLFKTRTLYAFLEGAKLSQGYIIQDICLPLDNVVEFGGFIQRQFNIYPLWLCPLRPDRSQYLSPTYLTADTVINIGIWGQSAGEYREFVRLNRQLEAQVSRFGGRKVLYAHAYYTEAEFWRLYDRQRYDGLRKKYAVDTAFPDLYAKTHVAEQYEPSVTKGLLNLVKALIR